MTATISGDGTSTLINLTTSGNTVLGDASTDTLNVGNGGLVKDASGNVGIGTASPTAKLHVANAGVSAQATFVGTTLSPYITVVGNSGTTILGNESTGGWAGTTGSQAFVLKTTDTERMRIDSSGNVGIGTASPAKRLQINSADTTDGIRLYCSDSGGENLSIVWQSAFGSNRITGDIKSNASGAGGNFILRTANTSAVMTEALRVDNAQNLLVGTTSVLGGASGKIALYSSDLTATNGATIKNGTANTGGAFIRFINSSDATIGSISQNASTTVAYNTSSDARLKTSLGVSTDTSVVDTLIIHDFKWKESGLTD